MAFKTTIVHRVWAEALHAIAREQGKEGQFEEELTGVCETLATEPLFLVLARTPHIRAAAKQKLIRTTFEGQVSQEVLNLLLLATEKRRLAELDGMRAAFVELVDRQLGRQRVDVTTALGLGPVTSGSVQGALEQSLGKQVLLNNRVDPAILGGLVIEYGDTRIDGSVRRRLQAFNKQIKEKIRQPVQP